MNIESLVKKYKETKDKNIMNQIYVELIPLVEKKSRYIFEQKKYPYSLYHKCIHCRKKEKLLETYELTKNTTLKSKIAGETLDCICKKGLFNLQHDTSIEKKDVEHDLWLKIIKIIDNYDITKSFNTYLYASIFDWQPSFLTTSFVNNLEYGSLIKEVPTEDGSYTPSLEFLDEKTEVRPNLTIEEIKQICKTEKERKVIQLLEESHEITHEEIAKEIGITQQAVSSIISKLRKKLKKRLLV